MKAKTSAKTPCESEPRIIGKAALMATLSLCRSHRNSALPRVTDLINGGTYGAPDKLHTWKRDHNATRIEMCTCEEDGKARDEGTNEKAEHVDGLGNAVVALTAHRELRDESDKTREHKGHGERNTANLRHL